MTDFLALLTTGGFFAICIGYVRWCDAVIGQEPIVGLTVEHGAAPEEDTTAEVAA